MPNQLKQLEERLYIKIEVILTNFKYNRLQNWWRVAQLEIVSRLVIQPNQGIGKD